MTVQVILEFNCSDQRYLESIEAHKALFDDAQLRGVILGKKYEKCSVIRVTLGPGERRNSEVTATEKLNQVFFGIMVAGEEAKRCVMKEICDRDENGLQNMDEIHAYKRLMKLSPNETMGLTVPYVLVGAVPESAFMYSIMPWVGDPVTSIRDTLPHAILDGDLFMRALRDLIPALETLHLVANMWHNDITPVNVMYCIDKGFSFIDYDTSSIRGCDEDLIKGCILTFNHTYEDCLHPLVDLDNAKEFNESTMKWMGPAKESGRISRDSVDQYALLVSIIISLTNIKAIPRSSKSMLPALDATRFKLMNGSKTHKTELRNLLNRVCDLINAFIRCNHSSQTAGLRSSIIWSELVNICKLNI